MTIKIDNCMKAVAWITLGLAVVGYVKTKNKNENEAEETRKEMLLETDDIKNNITKIANCNGLTPEERAVGYIKAKDLYKAIQSASTRKDVEKAIKDYREFIEPFDTWDDAAIRVMLIALQEENNKKEANVDRENRAKNIKEIADAIRSINKQVSPYLSHYVSLDLDRRWL